MCHLLKYECRITPRKYTRLTLLSQHLYRLCTFFHRIPNWDLPKIYMVIGTTFNPIGYINIYLGYSLTSNHFQSSPSIQPKLTPRMQIFRQTSDAVFHRHGMAAIKSSCPIVYGAKKNEKKHCWSHCWTQQWALHWVGRAVAKCLEAHLWAAGRTDSETNNLGVITCSFPSSKGN
jgi:hypothetical protein